MIIKIVDSWLREFLDTKANAHEIARALCLTSVSVERIEKRKDDFVYEIEVTTNRPDLMSVSAIAKEASAVLPQQDIPAKYKEPKINNIPDADISFPIEIVNNPKLVNRILAVVLEVKIAKSPEKISKRLEESGIRSLNNVIDVTNYVMRELGHPCHVFDYDLLNTKRMIICESKPGEIVTTLDGKEYRLKGGDIVAKNETGEIIDLLGIMGTKNSVVQAETKRILFFLDNLNPVKIRQTSMNLGIRTEAAIINEKGIDPQLMEISLKRGVQLYGEIAQGKVISKVLDLYPNKSATHTIKISNKKISKIIGVNLDIRKSVDILKSLDFRVKIEGDMLEIIVPTIRANEVIMQEDIIEEIARVYGYHKLPSIIPPFLNNKKTPYANTFFYEERIKNALKYWGYTETFTYSLISESQYDGPINSAIKLKNPLSEDMLYLRNSLVPCLLQVVENNKNQDFIKIFELSNTYHKIPKNLPIEKLMLAGVIKKQNVSFFEAKGLIEQLLIDNGIKKYQFKAKSEPGAEIYIEKDKLGYIEILNNDLIDFELNFEIFLKHATNTKTFIEIAKFPPIFEDLTFVLETSTNTQDVIEEIKLQNFLINDVTLKDQFEDARTFHIIYQAQDKNLTNSEIKEIREQIIKSIEKKFKAKVK